MQDVFGFHSKFGPNAFKTTVALIFTRVERLPHKEPLDEIDQLRGFFSKKLCQKISLFDGMTIVAKLNDL